MTAQQSKSYRAALVRIIRNAGLTVNTSDGLDALGAQVVMVGRSAPSLVAAHLTRLFNAQAQAWVRETDGSIPEVERRSSVESGEAKGTTAENVLKLFGIEVDYPGLYPTFKVNGYEEHDLCRAIRESSARKATR